MLPCLNVAHVGRKSPVPKIIWTCGCPGCTQLPQVGISVKSLMLFYKYSKKIETCCYRSQCMKAQCSTCSDVDQNGEPFCSGIQMEINTPVGRHVQLGFPLKLWCQRKLVCSDSLYSTSYSGSCSTNRRDTIVTKLWLGHNGKGRPIWKITTDT